MNAEAARLHASGEFQAAIDLIEGALPQMVPEDRLAVLPEIIKSANDGGLRDVAQRYCRELALRDPDMPLVRRTRALWGF